MADEKINNFKKLNIEYEDHFTLPRMEATARNIKNKKDNALTTGNIFNLFGPTAFGIFTRILGGENDKNNDVPPHTGESPRHSEPKGPGER